jgi:DNA invertase Pin-like site-specific DNA recombinase
MFPLPAFSLSEKMHDMTASQGWGYTLDESLAVDQGYSAFKGDNLARGSLAKFMELVNLGRIKSGSVLVIENIDRLSRQEPLESLEIVRTLVNAGITVATVQDRQEYSRQSMRDNAGQIFVLIGNMQRAHNESMTKSSRGTERWGQIHKMIRAKDFAGLARLRTWNGGRHPDWISWNGSGYVLNQEKAPLVRRIVKMASSGISAVQIAQTLNREKVPPLSRRVDSWRYASISTMLRARTLIGEYQPCKMVTGRQEAAGGAVEGFYPAVISETQFHALQGAMKRRKEHTKGRSGNNSNLFGRMLKSGHDGSVMYFNQKRPNATNLISFASKNGLSEFKQTFPYCDFEWFFLRWIVEVPLAQLNEPINNTIETLEAELSKTHGKILALQKIMDGSEPSEIGHLAESVKKYTREETKAKAALDEARAALHSPLINTADIQSAITQMQTLPEPEKSLISWAAPLRS